MQYTHKDTCNNQMLPHPTTPLGTLTHKTPPQHSLEGNSWTTSDLHVMSIVLGLLDTPSYKKYPKVLWELQETPQYTAGIIRHAQMYCMNYKKHPKILQEL